MMNLVIIIEMYQLVHGRTYVYAWVFPGIPNYFEKPMYIVYELCYGAWRNHWFLPSN